MSAFIKMAIKRTIQKHNTKSQRRKTQKIYKPMSCSPAVIKNRVHKDTCFTPEILFSIKKAYNKNNPEQAIKETDPIKIWWALKNQLSCQKEDCWLEQLPDVAMKAQIKRFIFAPKQPPEWRSNPDEWLTNYDIENVAKQYEAGYPEFKMIGPTMIDFDTRLPEEGGKCVLEDLCRFDLARFIRAKRTKIGIVFNLDRHDQSGSHWVSAFIDVPNKFIFFFDSADNPIPPEIWKEKVGKGEKVPLVNRIIEQGKQLSTPIHFKFYNNRGHSHQQSNTECGMYSLFFIITMLTAETPFTRGKLSVKKRIDMFKNKRIPDKTVFGYRKLYFND
jgi:hypothetical protein